MVLQNEEEAVMIVSRITVWRLFVEKAVALGLLTFFTIAERVVGEAHSMATSLRVAVCMRSRTDDEACAYANCGQFKSAWKEPEFVITFVVH